MRSSNCGGVLGYGLSARWHRGLARCRLVWLRTVCGASRSNRRLQRSAGRGRAANIAPVRVPCCMLQRLCVHEPCRMRNPMCVVVGAMCRVCILQCHVVRACGMPRVMLPTVMAMLHAARHTARLMPRLHVCMLRVTSRQPMSCCKLHAACDVARRKRTGKFESIEHAKLRHATHPIWHTSSTTQNHGITAHGARACVSKSSAANMLRDRLKFAMVSSGMGAPVR